MNIQLNNQELEVLISSLQLLPKNEENSLNRDGVSAAALYNKLYSSWETSK